MSLLQLENVVQRYRERRTGREFEALRVHELAVEAGEVLAVVGPNGSGKSTLLEALAFLVRPSSGRALLDGVDAWREGKALWARRRVPMLLQRTYLFAGSVLDNVLYGLHVRGVGRTESKSCAENALQTVGLGELAHRRHSELSGGERRRVALARLLAVDSPVIVLDEPTAGLDRGSEKLIEDLIGQINRERGTTVIMSSHNFRQAVELSTRMVSLIDGKLMPVSLDNLLFGVMRRTAQGLEFRERGGWVQVFTPAQMAVDAWEGVGPVEGPVKLAIASGSIRVAPASPKEASGLIGEIDVLRRRRGVCRVGVKLHDGPHLHAELPLEAFAALDLRLGATVALQVGAGAVRVLAAGQV
jgi:tungstate transport system ATP-binding protein